MPHTYALYLVQLVLERQRRVDGLNRNATHTSTSRESQSNSESDESSDGNDTHEQDMPMSDSDSHGSLADVSEPLVVTQAQQVADLATAEALAHRQAEMYESD
jgi:hypothetical protein